jgi:hypothetical protein
VINDGNARVTIRGVNLRPYLRVSFDAVQGRTFLFQDSTRAEIELNPMPPGVYDVILYDFAQERHRLPKALTVRAVPDVPTATEVMVPGRFINLTRETAALIKPGVQVSIAGQVVETAPARPSIPRIFAAGVPMDLPTPSQFEVPAIMKMPCVFRVAAGYPECGGGDFPLRSTYLFKSTLAGDVPAPFQVDQVYGTAPVKTLHVAVTFLGPPETLAVLSAGDADLDLARNPFALGARIESLRSVEAGPQPRRQGTLAIRAQQLPSGWWHGSDSLRVAGQFALRTDRYTVVALVNSFRE